MKTASGFDGAIYEPIFWRTSQYESFDEAERLGGIYPGETCYGYGTFEDAMRCALAAAKCLDGSAGDDLRVRVTIDGQLWGDKKLSEI